VTYDCAVLGAGIHGLCTAFWLHRRGCKRIALVERHGPAHTLGSSHGALRITRSSYHEASFVHLAARAHRDGWPALERALGKSLRIPTPGVFFGPPDGLFGDYLRATLAASTDVQQLDVDEAGQHFPLLRFAADDAVLLDRSAAMVLAAETMAGLRAFCTSEGIEVQWHTPVQRIDSEPGSVRVVTPRGSLHARTVVVAAGPWLARLQPRATPAPVVLRQQVGYFDLDAPAAAVQAGTFPVWARIGRGANDFQYGLPAHGQAGVKAARHVTAGPGIDPDAPPPPIDENALLALARERFVCTVRGLQDTEHCLYTMTPDQRFLVHTSPDDRRIVTIAACSGHGFKFGPVIGQLAADTVLQALESR